MMLAPGWRWMLTITAGVVVHPRRLLHVLGVVDDVGHVGQPHRRAVPVGDDERAVIVARQHLIVGADRVRLVRAVEAALGLVHVGLRDGRAQVFEGEPVRGERRGVRLDAHRRLLPAADAHEPDARQLRDLLREARVRKVLHLRQRQRLRGQREGQNRRVGGIDLAVDRRIGQIARQVRAGGVDGRLHLLFGHVDVELRARTAA